MFSISNVQKANLFAFCCCEKTTKFTWICRT